MIIVPRHRDLILPISVSRGVRGYFKIEAECKFTGKRRVLADWFPNLITTLGADLLGGNGCFNICAVGSGNTAPALANTALQTLVAQTTTINSGYPTYAVQSSAPYFGSTVFQYGFAAGVATGNLSEVGVGNTATSLFSRALILDGGGSPTTITVLSTEALYVTYQLNQYSQAADSTGTLTLNGTNYGYTLRASYANNAGYWAIRNNDSIGIYQSFVADGAFASVTGAPAGNQAYATSYSNPGYSNGSYSIGGTATWGLAAANFAGGLVNSVWVSFGVNNQSRGAYQIGFGTGVPKDSSHVLTLTLSTSWAINTP